MIINNKMYDTDTAEHIVQLRGGILSEELYKTKKGTFFIFDVMSRAITLVTECEVKDILGHKDTKLYIELFGEVEEG